jgi:hypothetical protein
LNLPSTAVGRRVLGTGCRSLVRPILLSAVLPPLTHRQAIGLSHHTEAFSEGYGVDGTHFKMIMDHADSASVLRDYGVSSVKEQIQLRAHWDRIGTSDASGRGGRGKGRGGRGVGRGQLSAAAGSSTEPPPTPAPTLFATELPPGWHEAATPEGRPYYYDNGGLTQWERPAAPAAPATPAAPPQQEAAQQAEEPRELLQEEREAEATRGAEAERATSHTKEARMAPREAREAEARRRKEARRTEEAAEALKAQAVAQAEASRSAARPSTASAEAEARRAARMRAAEAEEKERKQRISLLQAEEERRRQQQQQQQRRRQEEEELRHDQAAQRGELARLLPSPTARGASLRNVVLDVANLGHYTASNATHRFGRDCRWHRCTPLA